MRTSFFYDEEDIHNLIDIAQQYCPYNEFCYGNRTQIPQLRPGYSSCCKDCYCDEQFGDRLDCCWDFMDKAKNVEKNDLACVLPAVLPTDENKYRISGYFMMGSRPGNGSNKCAKENVAVWGSPCPIYSQAKSVIYYNKHCPDCNGMDDSFPWVVYISCNGGTSLFSGLKRNQCTFLFRPPRQTM